MSEISPDASLILKMFGEDEFYDGLLRIVEENSDWMFEEADFQPIAALFINQYLGKHDHYAKQFFAVREISLDTDEGKVKPDISIFQKEGRKQRLCAIEIKYDFGRSPRIAAKYILEDIKKLRSMAVQPISRVFILVTENQGEYWSELEEFASESGQTFIPIFPRHSITNPDAVRHLRAYLEKM